VDRVLGTAFTLIIVLLSGGWWWLLYQATEWLVAK
jgi:hypothetical protein